MVVALRDYVNKNRFPGVILGLSGGIDSRSARPSRSMRWARTGCGA
jgi:NH3-dependent NAD+ synthetase